MLQSFGLHLPTINFKSDNQIQPNKVFICIGLEVLRCSINNLDDIFSILLKKVSDYSPIHSDKDSVRQLLAASVDQINQGFDQYAFENYQKIYYQS